MWSLSKGHKLLRRKNKEISAVKQSRASTDRRSEGLLGTVFSGRFMHCRRFDMGNMHYRGYKSSNDTQLHQKCLQTHSQNLYFACKYPALGSHLVVVPATA